MTRIRRITHCPVPGHGTRCVVAHEMAADNFHSRPTEERLALTFELEASPMEEHSARTPRHR